MEEIKNIKSDKKELRKFGITIGLVFTLIGLFLYFNDKSAFSYFLIGGVLFIIAGIFFSVVLKPLQVVWMILAVIMGFIMTRVILSILFYIVLTPIGFFMKIIGKDLLNEKINRNTHSYWNKREITEYKKEFTERQF
ncbi:SxtJ family membrane protein [Melioribacteraceae bacterium 4301-Me]|uniref:SxtJ family membrane protein n=1 Tax=Pyranulibacter aquaticus TaxID=3163344 RepID=UPI00359B6767